MKKLVFIAALPVLFSACKQPEPPASVTTPPTATSAPQAKSAGQLPEGVVLDVPYTLVHDDWVEEENARKRKTVIEFEQSEAEVIGRQVSESMVAAGYRLTSSSEARGGRRFNFRGDPRLRVSILVRPRGATPLQSRESTGTIEVHYTALADEDGGDEQSSN